MANAERLPPNNKTRMADKSFNRVLMQVVGPVLIILMIGALVYFLIEVFYRGPHAARLCWVFGLFTSAAVLVSRISVEEGMERAALFGFALAGATFVVTLQLVDFDYGALSVLKPVVVLFFIAIVMWSANRLTWDCTVIDESRDVSSIGILELVKRKFQALKKKKPKRPSDRAPAADSNSDTATKHDASSSAESTPEQSAASRFLFLFFANSKTKNSPGLWIFYFALAAFPIFGFGQWFARADEGWGYRWIFFLFAIYLGAALGLLMMTSLLGLERYLNKRGAEMPAPISRSWMIVGTLFAIGVMLVMLVVPSPSLSLGFEDRLSFFTTDNKNTSKHAVGKDGQEDGDDPKGEKKAEEQGEGAKQKPGSQGDGDGGKSKNSKTDSKSKGDSKGKQGDKSQGDKSNGDKKGDQKNSNQGDKKNQQPDKQKPDQNKKQNQQDKNQNQKQDKNNANQNQAKQKRNNQNQAKQNQAKQNQGKQNQAKRDRQNKPQQQQPQQSSSSPSQLTQMLGKLMRFVIYGIGLVGLVVLLWMFRDELAKFWNDLFGEKEEKEHESNSTFQKTKPSKPQPPFSQYQNPFTNGSASKAPPAQTIQYTFHAFEAWSRDHGIERDADQTPHEFARKLPILFASNEKSNLNKSIVAEISNEAKKLADTHGESLYSGLAVRPSAIAGLKKIWNLMVTHPPTLESQQVLVQS
ncbi:MAG: hypothetical protein AB8B55_24185 [Mariniblastus sp.]